MIYELLKRLGIFPERGCNYASVQSVWRRRRTPLAKGDNVAKWPKWQNGHKMVSRPKCGWFQAHLRIELSLVLWVSAWLIDSNESDNVTAASLDQAQRSRKSYNTRSHSPRIVLSPSSSSLNQFEYSRCSANATHSNCFHAVSLSLSLSVCLYVLYVCLVYLSVCLSIRLNSPSNCSVLYDLFRSITRSLVTESGSDITLWFCFDLLCSWFELLFGFYF